MNALFGRELYIRLAHDQDGFVCTTKYGKFYSKARKFLLHEDAPAHENGPAPVRKRRPATPLSLLSPDLDASDQE